MAVFLVFLGAISRYPLQSFQFVILSLSKYKLKRISTAIRAKNKNNDKRKKRSAHRNYRKRQRR